MRRTAGASLAAMLALLGAGISDAAPAKPRLSISVLSGRADLVSGGDALVAIGVPRGVKSSRIRVTAGARNVTRAFAMRPNGRFEGLVGGLPLGRTTLVASLLKGPGARLPLTNHPAGGPLFSGPQVQPWSCQPGAADRQCNDAPGYRFLYMPSAGGSFRPYDPRVAPPASSIALTTTDEGVRVPFVIRIETGHQNRDQYRIATLYDPTKPWAPWAPQRQFNHKLLITHGANCGGDHGAGEAPSVLDDVQVTSSPTVALGRGFAVLSTALDNAGHNCNVVTEAESLVMAKERLVENYGELRYTIGTGCSGGSLAQQQVANAYPGVYQGIITACSFPDTWSTTQQLADLHLLRQYFENPLRWGLGVVWTPLDIAAVEGHPNHLNTISNDLLLFTSIADPTYPCGGIAKAQRYDPRTNRSGVRCSLADYMVNVFGRRPRDGFAGRPIDNVGVQYGLDALRKGRISAAQFADVNAAVGGLDIDARPQGGRMTADQPALANAYRSGAINEANNLDRTAIIDLHGTDPGAYHDVYRPFAMRRRLDREHGGHANQVMWQGPVPLYGDFNFTTRALLAMDRWLAAVERDRRAVPQARKIVVDRPADIRDQCSDGAGHIVSAGSLCPTTLFPPPRVVAGEGLETDLNKCRLKELQRSEYPPSQLDAVAWAKLQRAFPDGVCDWSRPGVDQQGAVPWMTYSRRIGGEPLGAAPQSRAFTASCRHSKLGRRCSGH